jgi:hypothetical protein
MHRRIPDDPGMTNTYNYPLTGPIVAGVLLPALVLLDR